MISLLVAIPTLTHAQAKDIWEAGKTTKAKVRSSADKKISVIQAWKKHLEQWGLDSSYKRSASVSGRLNGDGWSAGLVYGINRGKHVNLWQLYFSEVKHEKETKLQRSSTAFPELGQGTPYIYGKINYLYLLQLNFSQEKVLFPALLEGNVAIGFRYGGGLSLAMLKPYYLELIYPDYSTTPATAVKKEEAYSEVNRDQFLDNVLILGRGTWSKGLGDMQYIPGLNAEAALCITPKKGKAFIQSVTLGGNVSVFTDNLVMMADNKAYPWRATLLAGLEIGKRWR